MEKSEPGTVSPMIPSTFPLHVGRSGPTYPAGTVWMDPDPRRPWVADGHPGGTWSGRDEAEDHVRDLGSG